MSAEPIPREAVLIDLSSIAHPIWHMSQSDPDPNHTSIQTVAKVRALATGQPFVAVCCDSGRSFRAEIDPTYKANRPERDATLSHQIGLAIETLRGDGFPVWAVKGFEADDLIATGARLAQEAGMSVLVVSSDKDLLALVGPNVRAKSLRDGAVLDRDAVVTKFGVEPEQMTDYLCLVGDSSDNIKGANGIGPKGAVKLLLKWGSLEKLLAAVAADPVATGLKPSEAASLAEFATRYPTVRRLIALRDDAPIPFSEITRDRIPKDAESLMEETMEEMTEEAPAPMAEPAPEATPTTPPAASTALAVREAEIVPAPAEWERQLDPRSMREARQLAEDMHKSRMFSAYGTPHAVLSTVMVGRELGLPAMAALRSIHVVEGRHSLSAALMVALILKSGLAEFFRPVTDEAGNMDADEKHATFETLRKGAGEKPVRYTFTIEDAARAGLVKEKSNWVKSPRQMLVARAQSNLARLVYPDLMAGLYTPDELEG